MNRIKGLLFSQGASGYEPLHRNRRTRLEGLRTGDGRPLPVCLKRQISRELDRLELLLEQIKAVEAERDTMLALSNEEKIPTPAKMLMDIKGIGAEFATVLWSEGFFRHFDNRRQVAAYAGLAPTPWQSGTVDREQGVAKSGNARLRTTMLQLAWLAADTIYGVGEIERDLRRAGKGYVLGVKSDHIFRSWDKPRSIAGTARDIAENLKPSDWRRISAGMGTKGPRLHDWCYLELADLEAEEYNESNHGLWTRGMLIRRNIADGDLAYFTTWCPAGTSIDILVKVEGRHAISAATRQSAAACAVSFLK
ncbi:transposase [Acidiphilium sp. AL]|nr:transposase [Acidiphilium sp. AL]